MMSSAAFLASLLFSGLSLEVSAQEKELIDTCNDLDLDAASEASEDVAVQLLQSHLAVERNKVAIEGIQKNARTDDGCDPNDDFAVPDGFWRNVDDSNHLVNSVDGVDVNGTNPRQTSMCSRTKEIFDTLQDMMQQQSGSCQWNANPMRILSVGCSVGIEAREARGRFPDAEIVGYDINEPVVELANTKWDPALKLRFTANASDVPADYFDLITVNNVLVEPTEKSDFLSFLGEWRNWLRDGGILEIQTLPGFSITDGSDPKHLVMANASDPCHFMERKKKVDAQYGGGYASYWLEQRQRS